MLHLFRVVKRGKIDSRQITPKGVEALQIALAEKKIWKHLLISKYRWAPSIADRVLDELAEVGYIERQDNAGPTRRREYVLTNFGRDVVPRYKVPARRMKVNGLMTNMGGGLVRVRLDNLGFGMTAGTYFSAPTGLDNARVESTESHPVLGSGIKICPECGEINADELSCSRCGTPLQTRTWYM